MPRVDFVISNDRHHVAMTVPVARRLIEERGIECRVLSLCELRGLRTPTDRLEVARLPVERLMRRNLRSSPAAGAAPALGRPTLPRRASRAALWHVLVAPRLRRLLDAAPPAAAVLPNDAAYPYDRIADLLTARSLPFLLLQEGIRFPLPRAEAGRRYGAGGATAVAAWGEASGEYFAGVGVAPQRIHLTGSPRFDRLEVAASPPGPAALAARLRIAGPALLLVSNPIDDLGFCTRREKLALVERFLAGLGPLLAAGPLTVVLKLHAREAVADFERVAERAGVVERTRIVADEPLPELLALASAVVILASTVGLEALRAGRRLGVLEIPGFGFVHDYVSSGAAAGLGWDRPIAQQVGELLRPAPSGAGHAAAYVGRQLAVEEGAARRVAGLLAAMVEARGAG